MASIDFPLVFSPRLIAQAPDIAAVSDSDSRLDHVNGRSRFRLLPDNSYLAVSPSGDYLILSKEEVDVMAASSTELATPLEMKLRSRFFDVPRGIGRGSRKMLLSRQAAKRATVSSGPSLHIIVPTLQCAHSCQYCQVSRSLDDYGHTISYSDLDAACDAIFVSAARTLTVEFQGGDPLLRFDLVEYAIRRISIRNEIEERTIRFVVASTLNQLTPTMCAFFSEFGVFLSTSVDGPTALHNRNRPTPTRDAHQKTIAGIELARRLIGPHSVSALMTTTKASLAYPDEIVDEYVRLGLHDIFLRPLSSYGFAKRNQARMGYSLDEFMAFYTKALDRVLWWNSQGVPVREVYSSIIFNKILSTFDAGYVDLQSPTGAGTSVLVYNYDGYVYPSDEARMLAETGDTSLRICRIAKFSEGYAGLPLMSALKNASEPGKISGCDRCAHHLFCGPNPVDSVAQHGSMSAPVLTTEHCQRHMRLFDSMYMRLKYSDETQVELFHQWARPLSMQSEASA